MLRLITLGRIELTDAAGRPIESILGRPKRLALLAYLAAGGPGSLRSRDQVLALFWPETTQAKARQSLNQAIHVLRRALGHGVIVSLGNDQVGVAPGALWCDAVAVRDAVRSGDHRSAQTHYRGEFLPGFYLSDAPDFEKWLDGERATLRRLASSSAWKLAEEAAAAGDVETAAQAAARSAELSLREEAAVRRAIELLDSLGERARALDLYRELESDLAEDLGTRPAPETQEVVARVRAREAPEDIARAAAGPGRPPTAGGGSTAGGGGREGAGSTAGGGEGVGDTPARAPAPARARLFPPPPAPARARPRRAALVALPLLAIAIVVALVWLLTRPPAPAVAGTTWDPHLLIEPFDAYGGDDRVTDIAGAITTSLAARLAEVDAIEVLLVEAGNAPSADSAALALDARPAGTRAWFILRGQVMRDGARMKAIVSLIDRASGQLIASADIQRVTSDPLGFIEDASEDAAEFARAAVGRELRERAWRMSTSDGEAWALLERAERDRLSADALMDRKAMAAADAALAQADSLLARAEEREPRWVPPIVMRAQVAHDRMWVAMLPPMMSPGTARQRAEEGLAHAQRAVALDSTDARARELHGIMLHWRTLLGAVSADAIAQVLEETEAELRAAVRLEERRPRAWSMLSAVLHGSGRFDEAYYAAQQAFEVDAYLDAPEDILVKLFSGAFESGDEAGARDWCAALRERFTQSTSSVLCGLTLLAWTDDPVTAQHASDEGRRLIQASGLAPTHPTMPHFELLIGRMLAIEGERDSAVAIIRRVRASEGWHSELLLPEAAIRLALDQPDSAAALIRQFMDEQPEARQGLIQSRRFRELRE